MDITFDKISRRPYYFFDGKFHNIDTYKPYYIGGVWDNPHLVRFIDIPINTARVKSQLAFVITRDGWIIYGHYGDFVYKLAESKPSARAEGVMEIIPFSPFEALEPNTQLDPQYQQLTKIRMQIIAPLFITFQEIAQKLSKGLIISYKEEPGLIELSATGNPIMRFVENERNVYLVEVKYEDGTIYPV